LKLWDLLLLIIEGIISGILEYQIRIPGFGDKVLIQVLFRKKEVILGLYLMG